MPELFLKSKVREFVKSFGLKTSRNVTHGSILNKRIEETLRIACERAIANQRKTLMEKDL